jgi:type IV secretion system protein VirB2
MLEKTPFGPAHLQFGRSLINRITFMMMMALSLLPSLVLAQDTSGTTTATCGFLTNVSGILNAVSIVVVTIAIIFTGYKIAFAHARIGEVAPVLIGAILIGAASQIANIFLKNSSAGNSCSANTAAEIMATHMLNHVTAVVHILTTYA